MTKNVYKEALDKVVFLYEGYSKEYRLTTQPFHLERTKRALKNYKYNPEDLLIREPLIEHSGSLPIVATALYPYINDPKVDLGRALTMLAIHDIGELITGDKMVFTKKKGEEKAEMKAALSLLPKSLHDIYLEIEEVETPTGRFAKSIDKITPDILDMLAPAEVTVERYKKLVGKKPHEIVPLIKEFKHPYMLWNEFMTNFHLEILARTQKKLK